MSYIVAKAWRNCKGEGGDDNPSVCPSGSHLPLHKGGFGARRSVDEVEEGVEECAVVGLEVPLAEERGGFLIKGEVDGIAALL